MSPPRVPSDDTLSAWATNIRVILGSLMTRVDTIAKIVERLEERSMQRGDLEPYGERLTRMETKLERYAEQQGESDRRLATIVAQLSETERQLRSLQDLVKWIGLGLAGTIGTAILQLVLK